MLLWNPGDTDIEIFVLSRLVFLSFCVHIVFIIIRTLLQIPLVTTEGDITDNITNIFGETKGTTLPKNASDRVKKLQEDILINEREAKRLSSPDTFVQYAKAQRAIATQRRLLEIYIKEDEAILNTNKEQELKSAHNTNDNNNTTTNDVHHASSSTISSSLFTDLLNNLSSMQHNNTTTNNNNLNSVAVAASAVQSRFLSNLLHNKILPIAVIYCTSKFYLFPETFGLFIGLLKVMSASWVASVAVSRFDTTLRRHARYLQHLVSCFLYGNYENTKIKNQ